MNRMVRQAASTLLGVAILSGAPLAQSPAPSGASAVSAPATQPGRDSRTQVDVLRAADAQHLRGQLHQLLQRHPPSLVEVLRLDPTLLTNSDYLAPYPELAALLAEHPEVAHNPAFYIGTPDSDWDRDPGSAAAFRMWEQLMQGLLIIVVFSTITGVLVWLIRTLVEHRRWLRLTKVQTETHTKLLDRLTSQEDLLAYMQTPAGRRFLESAPIAVDSAARPMGAPFSRVLWSVQAGLVLALAGLGLLLVSRSALPEIAQGLWAIGMLTLALGIGFVLSAAITYGLSRRMGLFRQRPDALSEPLADPVLPRGRD